MVSLLGGWVRFTDDGTTVKTFAHTQSLMNITKSNGQLLIAGGITTDETL